MECDKCKKTFTQKCSLMRHINSFCWVKREEPFKERIHCLETQLALSKQQLETEVDKLTRSKERISELEQELNATKDRIYELEKQLAFKEGEQAGEHQLTEHLKEQTIRYENHILKEGSKPHNVIINNLAPFDLNPEKCAKISEEYTVEHFKLGPNATQQFVLEKYFTDGDGKFKVVCTDVARQIFKGKTIDGIEFIDVGGVRILKDVVIPLKAAIYHAGNELMNTLDEEVIEKRRKKHYKALEPNRLSKRLSGDLRS